VVDFEPGSRGGEIGESAAARDRERSRGQARLLRGGRDPAWVRTNTPHASGYEVINACAAELDQQTFERVGHRVRGAGCPDSGDCH
jgi:hypothetical protein